jgi:molecular chaperone GrpE
MAKKPLAGQPDRAGERPPAGMPRDTPKEVDAPADEAAAQDFEVKADEAEDAASDVEKDLDELETAQRERDEYLELAQRTRADFDNYRKRVAKETSEALNRGKAELARDLIPVVDNLERALQSSRPEDQAAPHGGSAPITARSGSLSSAEEAASDALAKGVALVLDELRGKLEAAGVETYDPVGERFDPELHEALSTRPQEGADAGVVLETLEKGYRLNGQVLRPARVVVSA